MNQLVSVIIPVYNVEKYLDRCIESIVSQTYEDIEIILVDDGSTDSSPEICDLWVEKDNRIKVIHKANAGAGWARNTGLDKSTGNYILFVDSDDYIDNKTVEECLAVALRDKSDVVMYGRTDVDNIGNKKIKPINSNKFIFKNDEVSEIVLPGLFINQRGFGVGVCGKMFRSDVISDNNLRFRSEREFLSEDSLFLIELFANIKTVSILPENYYYYFQNNNSFSRTFKRDFQKMNDNFLECALQCCSKLGYSEEVFRNVKARYLIYSLSGMKQLFVSSAGKSEKKAAFKALFDNACLKSAVTSDVLAQSSFFAKLFWIAFKNKMHLFCYVMLWYRTQI